MDKYNDKQMEALEHIDGPLLILAGAGSGKTRVLTGKIAKLINEENVDERNILAFTFTNKAANEMKDRIKILLKKDVSHMWIGTFHSICSRILRSNIEKLGYTNDYTIYDSQDQMTLLKDVLRTLEINSSDVNLYSLLRRISSSKNAGKDYLDIYDSSLTISDREFAEIYKLYEEKKKENNALDFDDLIVKTLELFEISPFTLEFYQERFKYIFVDEYQDTNHSQYTLIKLLANKYKNITVVGDQDQSIYAWRGADISNITNFEKDFETTRVILLEQNYRSSKKILNTANKLIKNNQDRYDKNLWTDNNEGEDIVYKRLDDEGLEAGWVIKKIKDMRKEGLPLNEMAILYRTNAQSRVFEENLIKDKIDYKIVGGLKFYDRKEIKDLLAYLNLIVNDRDDLSLMRVINYPRRGIGEVTLNKLSDFSNLHNLSLYESLDKIDTLSRNTLKKLIDFKKMIEDFKSMEKDLSLEALVKNVYEDSGIYESFEDSKLIEDKSRMENVDSFISAIIEYEEREENANLRDYLQNVSLMTSEDKTEEDSNSLTLMTMHQAKGLEFDLVFIVGLEDGLFPSKRTVEEGNLEEERRLFYVAITRARKRLYISSAKNRRIFGKFQSTKESRFIDEIRDQIKVEKSERIGNSYRKEKKSGYREFSSTNRNKSFFRDDFLERKKIYEENKKEKYKSGDKVKHKRFGLGTIVMVEDRNGSKELTIVFDKWGLKKMSALNSPLEVIDG